MDGLIVFAKLVRKKGWILGMSETCLKNTNVMFILYTSS